MDQHVRLILIFAKATRKNAADAGRGLNRGGGWGLGARTLLAVPLTLWTCVSNADSRRFV